MLQTLVVTNDMLKKLFSLDADAKNRVFGLDLLRALAILIVVDAHSAIALGRFHTGSLLHQFLPDGVELFFVLSGFLIGGILIRLYEKHQHLDGPIIANFWTRRWFRTLPNYYFVLTALIALNILRSWRSGLHHTLPEKWTLVGYFLFLQNFAHYIPDFFPETWSLAIEEWSYLLLPTLLFCWHRLAPSTWSRQQIVLAVILTVLIATNLLRFMQAIRIPISEGELGYRGIVLTRLDAISYGVLAAYLKQYYRSFWLSRRMQSTGFWIGLLLTVTLAFTASIFILPYYVDGGVYPAYVFYKRTFYFTAIGLSMMLLLPRMDTWQTSRGWLASAITHISLISYSMYLLNLTPIMITFIERIPTTSLAIGYGKVGLFWVSTVLLATLLYRFYEKPMTSIRDRISKQEPKLVAEGERVKK